MALCTTSSAPPERLDRPKRRARNPPALAGISRLSRWLTPMRSEGVDRHQGLRRPHVKGHKIGLPRRRCSALNPASRIRRAVDDIVLADAGSWSHGAFIRDARRKQSLRSLRAKRLSGPDCTMFDVLNATAFVVPALEYLDTSDRSASTRDQGHAKNLRQHRRDNAANDASCWAGRRSAAGVPTCAGSARCAS